MAVDVTSLARMMRQYEEDGGGGEAKGKRRDLVTRDLLGGGGFAVLGSSASAKELDLDLHVPSGFQRRLDLLSGTMYLEKRGSGPVHRQLHDLNLPPPSSSAARPNDSSALQLDLQLNPAARSPPPAEYQSVCTLDKVRSALQRAGREPRRSDGSGSPCSSSVTTASVRRRAEEEGEGEGADGPESPGGGGGGGMMMAAGCPKCLLYVLISKGNPRCPRCDSHVPVAVMAKAKAKRPRIDLNQGLLH